MKKTSSKKPTKQRQTKAKKRKPAAAIPILPMNILLSEFHVCDVKKNVGVNLTNGVLKKVGLGLGQFGMFLMEKLMNDGHNPSDLHVCLTVTFDTGNHPSQAVAQTETIQ